MHQAGLFEKWLSDYIPKATRCMEIDYRKGDKHLRKITLSHLSGAFVILAIGYTSSFFIFCFDKLKHFLEAI